MRVHKLNDQSLVITGNAAGFLNGITSNALDAPLNAFLNQHGRVIATFRPKKISDDEFLISVPMVAVEALLKHLERYAKLARVTLKPSAQTAYIDVDTAQIVWSSGPETNAVSEEEFTLFRLNHDMPLMGIDYQADEFILNIHEFNYTSYTKGCFLGQEPVAKVHNRSKPTRKLVVISEDQCTPEDATKMTSKAFDPVARKTKGFVFVTNKLP